MNRILIVVLLVAHAGCAWGAEKLDRVGNKKLPVGAILMCDEHVVGEASGKPVHIDWQAFGFDEGTDKVVQFYQSQFGLSPVKGSDAQGYTWTFKGEYNELQYAVQSPSATGPWSGCSIQPTAFQAVILISNAIWIKGR
ncbi:hypothetical protein [Massilia sp. YIM B04103]|uniref:hypothetical protein n=1 Tax=Massilia sp. YIM B04103 TaxID=2963106 RepID=UPI002108664B|nr:hypothetical protein [Massilia sp. YIM B04103]